MRVLYIDIDTLRPDHLGCYGYHRNTSPNIDTIAKDGIRFDNYYCSDAPCLPSRTALTTGKFGIHTGVVNHGGLAADLRHEGKNRSFFGRLSFESLPGILRLKGLKTVSISPFADRHGAWHFYAGFDEMYNTGKRGMESAEDLAPISKKWIQDNARKDNWFLHINYWDPHTPYRAPEDFGNPFENEAISEFYTEELLNKHKKLSGPHRALDQEYYTGKPFKKLKNINEIKKLIDGYDTGIKYADHHIGLLFEELKKEGIFEDVAIIISSDHGENFGELGIYADHGICDNSINRIPLIIKWPKAKKNYLDRGLHYNLDLLPTIAELIDYKPIKQRGGPSDGPYWDGESFAETIIKGKDTSRDYLVLSQLAHVCQRAVRFEDWIYIKTFHDGFHLFPDKMLFDLKNDPYEQEDIADERADIVDKAEKIYKIWHEEMMASMGGRIDPLQTVLDEGGPYHAFNAGGAPNREIEYARHLRATGRDSVIERLKQRHPEVFKMF